MMDDRIEGPTHALRVIADSIECVRATDGRLVYAFPPNARLLDYVDAFASRDAFAADRRIENSTQALRQIADSMEFVEDRDGVTIMSFRATPRLLDYIGAFTTPESSEVPK